MKLLRIDSVGGASGDMLLAALIDTGVDAYSLKKRLSTLDVGDFDLTAETTTERHFRGTRVTVSYPEHQDHPHRHLGEIRNIIHGSQLPDPVNDMSLRVFERLAAAEALIHDTTPDQIAFHEVGAVDSIIDIVGACLALHDLSIDRVDVSPLPAGTGTVECAHGTMPVPAPATVELLKGHSIVQTDEPFELVTPTGAALLMEWKHGERQQDPEGTILGTGYGLGHRKLNSRPNLLRATVIDASAPGDPQSMVRCPLSVVCLECNLDDTVPELLGSLTQRLLSQGALDVFTTPVQMKKQRPGTLLTVLCDPATRDDLVDTIFTESTTFGIREYETRRTVLDRRHIEVATPYGIVRIKVGSWKGNDITHAPEHDDCVKCAEENNVPVRTVYEAAIRAL